MTLCAHCNKPLAYLTEAHAMDGNLFCSRDCAVQYTMNDIIANAKGAAIDAYNSDAEVVLVQDILADECGLVKANNSTHGFTNAAKEAFAQLLIKRDGCKHEEAMALVEVADLVTTKLSSSNASYDLIIRNIVDILGVDVKDVLDILY